MLNNIHNQNFIPVNSQKNLHLCTIRSTLDLAGDLTPNKQSKAHVSVMCTLHMLYFSDEQPGKNSFCHMMPHDAKSGPDHYPSAFYGAG